MPTNSDAVRLQLAMAFGQGAGCMLAEASALERLLVEQNAIISGAIGNWTASHWAFVDLVRKLGQVSATRAAMGGSAVIRWADIEASLPAVMDLCPCLDGPALRSAV
jgi:hypothetical protein